MEMTNCESVYILTLASWGSVEIADSIAINSALYDEGQLVILAEKLLVTWLSAICTQLMPIEQLSVPILDTELSV